VPDERITQRRLGAPEKAVIAWSPAMGKCPSHEDGAGEVQI